jgi:predicted transcriptional regulator
MKKMDEPEKIISARTVAKHLGISPAALTKYIRRGQVRPDFKAEAGNFFRYESIQDAKRAIEQNRSNNWRHLSAATNDVSAGERFMQNAREQTRKFGHAT